MSKVLCQTCSCLNFSVRIQLSIKVTSILQRNMSEGASETSDSGDSDDIGDIVDSNDIREKFSGEKRKRQNDATGEEPGEYAQTGEEPGEYAQNPAPKLPGDDLDSESESESEDEDEASPLISAPCPLCDLATSECVQAMNACSDRLAGEVSETRLCGIQLEIWNKRMQPLRQQNRPVPLLTLQMVKTHYTKHRVCPQRSVAEDVRVLENMQRCLRRTGLVDYDQDNNKVLVHRGSSEYCRISKQKADLLKLYAMLEKEKRKTNSNT